MKKFRKNVKKMCKICVTMQDLKYTWQKYRLICRLHLQQVIHNVMNQKIKFKPITKSQKYKWLVEIHIDNQFKVKRTWILVKSNKWIRNTSKSSIVRLSETLARCMQFVPRGFFVDKRRQSEILTSSGFFSTIQPDSGWISKYSKPFSSLGALREYTIAPLLSASSSDAETRRMFVPMLASCLTFSTYFWEAVAVRNTENHPSLHCALDCLCTYLTIEKRRVVVDVRDFDCERTNAL